MNIIRSADEMTRWSHRQHSAGRRIGFVPTMGCLHAGHLTLVRRAIRENDVVIASIFVNPTQFGPKEDFKHYPRTLAQDCGLLKRAKTDVLFLPTQAAIYPRHFNGFVDPGPLARYLCGPKRPGHFRGVATVVNRLFQITEPDAAYFGLKDYQQLRVIEEMVRCAGMSIRVVRCPTVREPDGLAMSSRNRYLSGPDRPRAQALYRSLLLARRLIRQGERHPGRIKTEMRKMLLNHVDQIDYIAVSDPETLAPLRTIKGKVLVAVACFLGRARLIDNMTVRV